MKLVAVLTASLLAFTTVISTHSQTRDLKVREAFQVKRNILIKDGTGAKLGELKAEEVKLLEDGAEQEILTLSANSSPLYLEIVLDDSGSMGSQRMKLAAMAKFIIESLEANSQVQIVRFGGRERVRLANEWTADKQFLLKTLEEAPLQGGNSPIFDATWAALDQIKEAKLSPGEKRFAIVLISDCIEGGSGRSYSELVEELARTDVPLFTVALLEVPGQSGPTSPRSEEFVQRFEKVPHDFALASGGSVYFPLKGDNAKLPVSESLKGLAAELQSQFVVSYKPTNQARDGKERKVRIDVAETFDGKRVASVKETHVITVSK